MVKVINIDTKTKTIRIDNADSDIKTWRTTESGTHFPIREGESTKEALDKFVGKKQEESPAMRAAREASERMSGLKLAIGDKKNGVKKESGLLGDRYDAKHGTKPEKSSAPLLGDREVKDVTQPADKKHYEPKAQKEYDKKLWEKAHEEASKRAKGYPTFAEVQSMYDYMQEQQQPAKKESVDMWAKPKSHEGSESFKSAMQETMKSFPRLYDFEKQPLESFAEDIYGKLQENPGKEKEVLDHYVDAYKSYIATLGPWVDTPTLAKKAFLDKILEQHQSQPAEPERDWQRGDDEDEDAYFDRRDKTMAEARKIDKVSDWYKKAFKGDDDGLPTNKNITFKELADGLLSGDIKDFYETVGVGASDVREKIFEELSERTGRPYDDFYDAWLHGGKKGTESRKAKAKEDMAFYDKLLKTADLDPELRKAITKARERAKKES